MGPSLFILLATFLGLAMVAPNTLYVVSQRVAYKDWRKRMAYLPFLVVVGIGLALSNSWGVMEAILGHKSGFVRTPKRGDKELLIYRAVLPWSGILEIILGLYCAGSFGYYLAAGKYLVGPFLAAYASGFLFMGLLTWPMPWVSQSEKFPSSVGKPGHPPEQDFFSGRPQSFSSPFV